ncbi:MAG TPA: hypothetical protein PLX34_22060, partial [Sedimentisphaerales bacterium]|nr:hypothetical protein [Sedimentisphaerales bacterium]
RHVVVSAAVLAGGGDKGGFAARGGVEAAGVLVGRAVVVTGAALGSKIQVWRAVMGEALSKEEIKATRARVREHNRAMAQVAATAARNGHGGLWHDLMGAVLVDRLGLDLMCAGSRPDAD